MYSSVKPGAVWKAHRGDTLPATYPVSSSSSRAAHAAGSSPRTIVPAGSSSIHRSVASRQQRIMTSAAPTPDPKTGATITDPGCRMHSLEMTAPELP